jgi:hypothetical protein
VTLGCHTQPLLLPRPALFHGVCPIFLPRLDPLCALILELPPPSSALPSSLYLTAHLPAEAPPVHAPPRPSCSRPPTSHGESTWSSGRVPGRLFPCCRDPVICQLPSLLSLHGVAVELSCARHFPLQQVAAVRSPNTSILHGRHFPQLGFRQPPFSSPCAGRRRGVLVWSARR